MRKLDRLFYPNLRHLVVVIGRHHLAATIDEAQHLVPVLPPVGFIQYWSQWVSRRRLEPFFFVRRPAFPFRGIRLVSPGDAQKGFFVGLTSFLAARVGGVRWWRSHGRQSGQGGGAFRAGRRRRRRERPGGLVEERLKANAVAV
jgi:hypothetical protein